MNNNTTQYFDTQTTLSIKGKDYHYHSLKLVQQQLGDLSSLPYSLKILLENLLRHQDGKTVTADDIKAFVTWLDKKCCHREIAYRPARVLMQDFTGVPAVVDLAALRDAIKQLGGDPKKINPLAPVDLVIDHSVQVDEFATAQAFKHNVDIEMQRNHERYQFLRWGQDAFDNFSVVPPGTGICHQVNLEYLAKTIWHHTTNGHCIAYPDTVVGTDSHTTMINALGVLGWGVGGIEAEAAILGQPISMLIPEVVGFKLTGKLPQGTTATDLVLTITQMLRNHGVVGKFVEYCGQGLDELSLPDRATIANMAPEYGATCGFFPIDNTTLNYLQLSGRNQATIDLVATYAKAQGLWRDNQTPEPIFSAMLHLDLSTVKPSLAGPKRPQDRVLLTQAPKAFAKANQQILSAKAQPSNTNDFNLQHGDIVIAAITSCTNTSNPNVMIAAGLVAKKALALGLKRKPWVKSSLAPGSKVVTDYLVKTGLQACLDQLGFNLVGYGCTTCIGNSGPLPEAVASAINTNDLVVCALLSGNRNFEGRIHPLVKANWLASPPLVVAYALAGSIKKDLTKEAIGNNSQGRSIYLKDIWPTQAEINAEVTKIDASMFHKQYANVFCGDDDWNSITLTPSETYQWRKDSTYIRLPPFFANISPKVTSKPPIKGARILALLGDSVTTDHISPAGAIKADSPAGQYLAKQGVKPSDFNSYGARRGNHEVMMRGTFGNIRIRNEMVPGVEGGFTQYHPDKTIMPIYDAAIKYQQQHIPLIIIAGKEYGTGSSRDWAAKGTLLLGVRAVIAQSFERIHRSNLIGMGVLPLQFKAPINRTTLKLTGNETIDIIMDDHLAPNMTVTAIIYDDNGHSEEITLLCRIDTQNELTYYRHGGILHYVLRKILNQH